MVAPLTIVRTHRTRSINRDGLIALGCENASSLLQCGSRIRVRDGGFRVCKADAYITCVNTEGEE